jgi:hypothetical protein
MAVKDVNTNQPVGATAPQSGRGVTLSSLPTAHAPADSDSISLSSKEVRPSLVQHQLRTRLNKAIEAANVATGAMENISRFVGAIEGILEQVVEDEVSPARVAKLEGEAKALRDEILKAAQAKTSDGLQPLAGDPIRIELEQTLGKALEVILPDDAKAAFGIGHIDFSAKDLILDIVAKVQSAKQGIESLKNQLDGGTASIRSTVAALEVAFENAEASRSSVRGVDDAVNLARDTKLEIHEDPSAALESVGEISNGSAEGLLGSG